MLDEGMADSPEERELCVRMIRSECQRMLDVIEDILHLSRAGGKPVEEPQNVNVGNIAREIATSLSAQAAQKGIAISVEGDMVRMGRYPYKELFEQYDEKDEEIVNKALEKTGLLDFKQRTLGSMSGGEAQRALIAKCFAQTPEAIILDEPANGLDPIGIEDLRELIRSFARDGITVLVSSHILQRCSRWPMTSESSWAAGWPTKASFNRPGSGSLFMDVCRKEAQR